MAYRYHLINVEEFVLLCDMNIKRKPKAKPNFL